MTRYALRAVLVLLILGMSGVFQLRAPAQRVASPVGIFEGHGDVGKVLHEGSVTFDVASLGDPAGEPFWRPVR